MTQTKTYTGRIIKALAGFYYVKRNGDGIVYACKAKGIFRKRKHSPLVGDIADFIVTHEGDKEGSIEALHERHSVLARPTVANVDLALVVFALKDPQPNLRLLDRMLTMFCYVGIDVVVCFNKMDLVDDKDTDTYRRIYDAAGYPVIFISARDNDRQSDVENVIKGHLATVAGPSGAGKSSLINRLCRQSIMETGAVSDKIKRGKQTTRHIELLEVAKDTYIVDTPGFSNLDFLEISKEELAGCFPEIQTYTGSCKYVGCSHVHEPEKDCKVQQAVRAGLIASERFDSYRVFYEELEAVRKY